MSTYTNAKKDSPHICRLPLSIAPNLSVLVIVIVVLLVVVIVLVVLIVLLIVIVVLLIVIIVIVHEIHLLISTSIVCLHLGKLYWKTNFFKGEFTYAFNSKRSASHNGNGTAHFC